MYWCIDALRMQIVRKSKNSNNYEMFYVNSAGRMHGLKYGSCRFWQRTDSPPGSNMLRRAAQTCSACKLAGVQIIPLPTLKNQILARTFFRSVELQLACPDVGKFSRASSAGGRQHLQMKFRKSDRVGRRGLSEPREDFSRLRTCAIPWLDSVAVSVANRGAKQRQDLCGSQQSRDTYRRSIQPPPQLQS